MSGVRFRGRRQTVTVPYSEGQAQAAFTRLLATLNGYLDQGVRSVSIAEVLDLLDYRAGQAADRPSPLADPLTGAMPVLPEAYQ